MQEFMNDNTLYVILFIVLVIWLGIAVYINKVDRNLKNVEKVIETEIESQD